MKINVDRKQFASALETGAQMAGKNTIAILETVKMKIEDRRILITSFNGAVGVSTSTDANTGGDGKVVFCLVPERLTKILGLIEDEIVSMEISEDLKTMTVTHDGGSMNIPLLPSNDYPEFGKDNITAETSFDWTTLPEWARLAPSFTASDELRPNLNGMLLYSEAGEKGFCASDSHVLITDSVRDEGSPDFSVIIPGVALNPLYKCFRNSPKIRMKISEKSVIFHSGNISLYSQTVVGKFPNFKQIIPAESSTTLNVERKSVISSVKRALVAADSAMRLLVLSADDGVMNMTTKDMAGGASSTETCGCSAGTVKETGVKGDRFLSCISAVEGDMLKIHTTDPVHPIVLTGSRNERKILIMPCIIS